MVNSSYTVRRIIYNEFIFGHCRHNFGKIELEHLEISVWGTLKLLLSISTVMGAFPKMTVIFSVNLL